MAVKELIEAIELSSSASSITFSSIPQDYTHLQILISARTDRSSNTDVILIEPNGLTTNGSNITLLGNGTDDFSFSASDLQSARVVGNTATANTFSNSSIYISNYTASQAKSIYGNSVAENNASAADQYFYATLWNNTAAITSLNLICSITSSDFLTGSTFSLYGITRGGDGTVTTA